MREQLEKILEFRHGESLQTQNQALARLSSDHKVAVEQIAHLQTQSTNDSRLLKSLTALATLYLPASLVAVRVHGPPKSISDRLIQTIFSSNLVQLQVQSLPEVNSRLILAPHFWLYIVIALPLIFLTLIFIVWTARRSSRQSRSSAPP